MGRITNPARGPYAKWVAGFLDISDRAFSLLADVQRPEIRDADSAARRTLFDLSLNAETTSIATRFAITYSLMVPVFALTRVRLEQCIVSSFLVHAPKQDGMNRYLEHLPIQEHDVHRKYEDHFQTGKVSADLERRAHAANERLRGKFSKQAKFKRTWTRLRLSEMAQRRDSLAKEISPLPWRLEDDYWRLYPLTSLAVHGASESNIWTGEIHRPNLGEERYLYMLPERAQAMASAVARLDLIQAFETLNRLEGASLDLIEPLVATHRSAEKAQQIDRS